MLLRIHNCRRTVDAAFIAPGVSSYCKNAKGISGLATAGYFFLPKFGVWRCMLQLLSRRYNVIAAVLMHEWSETRCSVKVTIDECSPFWIELLPTTGPGWWVGSWIITLENVELVWSKWNNGHWIFFVGLMSCFRDTLYSSIHLQSCRWCKEEGGIDPCLPLLSWSCDVTNPPSQLFQLFIDVFFKAFLQFKTLLWYSAYCHVWEHTTNVV